MIVSHCIHILDDDMLTFMSVERVHCLRSKAQFERWMEEQDSIHNEAKWIPAYFHAKAETWRKLMHTAAERSLKGASSICIISDACMGGAFTKLSPFTHSHYKVFNETL